MPIVSYGYGKGGGTGGTKIVEALAVSVELNVTGGSPGVAKDACGREIKNWCFPAGDNPTIVVTVTDAADNSAVDLTGATAKLVVVSVNETTSPATITPLFDLTGAVQSPATAGIVHFAPSKAQANSGGVASYRYDVQLEFPDGTRRTVAVGDWVYDQDYADTGLD